MEHHGFEKQAEVQGWAMHNEMARCAGTIFMKLGRWALIG
jgi:hypothetical protein